MSREGPKKGVSDHVRPSQPCRASAAPPTYGVGGTSPSSASSQNPHRDGGRSTACASSPPCRRGASPARRALFWASFVTGRPRTVAQSPPAGKIEVAEESMRPRRLGRIVSSSSSSSSASLGGDCRTPKSAEKEDAGAEGRMLLKERVRGRDADASAESCEDRVNGYAISMNTQRGVPHETPVSLHPNLGTRS